jgi:CHAT domain-containing protein
LLLPAGAAPAGARLLIVPDGALHHLPFETLVPPGAGAAPSRLVEVCEIAYAPSASTLGALRRLPPVAARDLLALGDPAAPPAALGPWDLAPLPYAREEVERIGALFRPGDRRLLVGGEASEGALKTAAGRAGGMLHLAAHGWIDEEAPARSAILLASSPGEDGLLQMNEIYALRLPVRLAVLSACRSALGPLVRGEGMVGLTQAFLFAGTRAVVVSLWNVNDRAASGLMEHFYRELASGAPPRAALRLAKLRLLRSERETDRHPSIWAPFVLIGDPDAGAAVAPAAAAGRAPD